MHLHRLCSSPCWPPALETQITGLWPNRLPFQWHFVDCPKINGTITMHLKVGRGHRDTTSLNFDGTCASSFAGTNRRPALVLSAGRLQHLLAGLLPGELPACHCCRQAQRRGAATPAGGKAAAGSKQRGRQPPLANLNALSHAYHLPLPCPYHPALCLRSLASGSTAARSSRTTIGWAPGWGGARGAGQPTHG